MTTYNTQYYLSNLVLRIPKYVEEHTDIFILNKVCIDTKVFQYQLNMRGFDNTFHALSICISIWSM